MKYSVDVNSEYKLAKSNLLRCSLLFSCVFAIVLIADVLLVIFSKKAYYPTLIIAIVITVLFVWFAIFFFMNVYNDINQRYRYFKGYSSGLKPVEEVEFLKKSDEMCYMNGLYVYPVYVRYFIGINCQDKVIFAFTNELDYEMGDKLTIETYQRILVKAEKHL